MDGKIVGILFPWLVIPFRGARGQDFLHSMSFRGDLT